MEDFKIHFPALQHQTYLNTPASGLLSEPLHDWRRAQDKNFLLQGANYGAIQQMLQEVRTKIAKFFSSGEEAVALVPNFSFGINTVLEGLPKGQKVLLLKGDYPSVNWPVETRDFDVCYAEVDETIEENIEAAVAKHRPDVFLFSITQWLSGITIDLEFLAQLKSAHPNLMLIGDGTQFLGTQDFDFSASPLDVLGASGYKWLLSSFGNGFFMVKEGARERLFPQTIGFNSAEGFDSKATDTRFIKHFEPGHQDFMSFGTFGKSLELWEDWGKKRLFQQIADLSTAAKEKFTERGLLSAAVVNRKQHAPFFNLRGDEKLFKKLQQENIIASQRGGGIRVGFHFYNSEEDLVRLLSVL
ncbi:aminotransferase class V-fold PLP-dependent enzyme [Flavobacteriaceae bacterium TK19130]|nr:aminotransferase class V-fold PLP-dependent enzyme [Thermobacterium salinum]